MTFYAWIGRRNGDEFDEDGVDHSKAEARSDKGPSSLLVTHDVPANAWQVGGEGGAWIVDMDRRSSVEFTIQLQDEAGARLEREGVVIDIEVNSREILLDADNVTGNKPVPEYDPLRRDPRDTSTVVTDRRGEATFELDGPSRNERLDEVTIETDCCTETIEIAWSEGDPVLVSAKPDFNLYQLASSDGTKVEFTVEYNLYDQYGNALRGHTTRYTGRRHDVAVTMTYRLYTATLNNNNNNKYVLGLQVDKTPLDEKWSRGRLRSTLEVDDLVIGKEHFILIEPGICSTSVTSDQCTAEDRINYTESGAIVWVVEDAGNDDEFGTLRDHSLDDSGNLLDVTLEEVELYPADRKFRTFFTLWSYNRNNTFKEGSDDISMERFEELWEEVTD